MSYNQLDLNILKTLISNKKYALDFANEQDAKLFSSETWTFANIIITYIKTYKDVPTLKIISERLNGNEKLTESVVNIWKELDRLVYDDKEYKHDLERIKKRFASKQIMSIKDNLIKLDGSNLDVGKTITEMQKTVQVIKGLSQAKAYERKTLKEAVPTFREEYNAKLNDKTFDRGLSTGFSYLDWVSGGLRPAELLLIGAESGAGKSMMLMNMAVNMWLGQNHIDMESHFGEGQNILYFSLEMPLKPSMNRVLSRLANVPSKAVRDASLNSDDANKLKKALRFINKYPFNFEIVDVPRGASMENLELIYEEAKAYYDPKIIVIDYLGLMDYNGAEMDDWLKLGKIAEKIHEFARVHNVIVLSAVQLNRVKANKEEDRIGLHRVGRSALILQNANIAIQIETRPNEKYFPDMIYHIIKNREGELGSSKLSKYLANATLIDIKVEEPNVQFANYNVDDISQKIEELDL